MASSWIGILLGTAVVVAAQPLQATPLADEKTSSAVQVELSEHSSLVAMDVKQSEDSESGKPDEQAQRSDSEPQGEPEVLVPNPEIVIDGNSVPFTPATPVAPTPPLLPRAVAPPVGDIAVSNINTTPDMIDLETDSVVNRLVVTDAPVREVLELLARQVGLNVIYAGGQSGQGAEAPEGEEAPAAPIGQTISLDLENEPVQDVFNSVLMLSGLQANRRGNTIFVSPRLPDAARNLVSRTLRLNQVQANAAATFLATQGAEVQQIITPIEEVIDPETQRVVRREEQPPELQALAISQAEGSFAPLLLNGLKVSTDDRLNSITLVGEPSKVQIATSFLTQLDARRRQVAINVKVIDVNLLNDENFNASFSFGVNDSFFVQDNGSASLRFGEVSPPTSADFNSATGRTTNPPAVPNPFAGADTFLDLESTTAIPGTSPGTVIIDGRPGQSPFRRTEGRGALEFFNRRAGVSGDPFDASFTDFELAEDNIITIDEEGNASVSQGTIGTATAGLPGFFQYPRKFLAQLESQIVSGNAKILTDPTLVVQEGQEASVRLVQNVVESVETDIDAESGVRTITPVIAEAGLVLTVNIERIDDNGFVSLSVSPVVSAIGEQQVFDSGGGAENILNLLNRRELSSGLLRLRDGETLIVSGIIQESDRTTVSKVPILGDIPLLGSLFRSTNKNNERREVIVLLTPQIVDEDSNLGFNYVPGQDAREMMRQQGLTVPGNP
ncbi:MAG: secretin and TonB N-terminal domain-containing protein [Cyanophyceae cyanobacterium]